jgi:hypothetical protein
MQIDPYRIGYLKLASRRDGFALENVMESGESIRETAAPFVLPPEMDHIRLDRVA